MSDVEDLRFWDALLDQLRSNSDLYRSWFESLRPELPDGGRLLVHAEEASQAEYLRERCTAAFTVSVMALTGYLLTVQFDAVSESDGDGTTRVLAPKFSRAPLNPDHTFDQFVVGPSNRLAHAACKAVCSQPGTLYNPLFIHGESGLGKTHLLQAIAATLRRSSPGGSAIYVSCETFVNEFVNAIENGRLPEFRDAAREADALIIDDIQFLANRESSQEELFHTFNVLYQNRKQIILSADARPTEIPTLEDRLVSRFNWGLVTQIDRPNRETRHAILQKKARLRGCEVPDEVLDYVAQRVEDNVRVLEGALTKLMSERQIADKPLSVDTARDVLDAFQGVEPKVLLVDDIMKTVSAYYGLKVQDLLGRKRSRSIAHPRQIAMYLARKLTPLSLVEIGGHFGGRDHSTVLHAEKLIESERQREPRIADTLTRLTRQLLARN